MEKFLYAIKPIGVSKGYNRVYNKQEQIAKYKLTMDGEFQRIDLVEVLDFNNKVVKKHTFREFKPFSKHDLLERSLKTELQKSPIYTGAPRSDALTLFETREEAQAQKLTDLMQIKDYFKKALEGIMQQMEKNLPKDLDKNYNSFFTEYPEYLI